MAAWCVAKFGTRRREIRAGMADVARPEVGELGLSLANRGVAGAIGDQVGEHHEEIAQAGLIAAGDVVDRGRLRS